MKLSKLECNFKGLTDGATLRRIRKITKDENTVMLFFENKSNEIQFISGDLHTLSKDKDISILIGIVKYAYGTGLHSNHAIAAKIIGNKIFIFNAHGMDRNKILDDKIAKVMRDIVETIRQIPVKTIQYTGLNLQLRDTTGVCVGLSSNFITNTKIEYGMSKLSYNTYVEKIMSKITINNLENSLKGQGDVSDAMKIFALMSPEKKRKTNIKSPNKKVRSKLGMVKRYKVKNKGTSVSKNDLKGLIRDFYGNRSIGMLIDTNNTINIRKEYEIFKIQHEIDFNKFVDITKILAYEG